MKIIVQKFTKFTPHEKEGIFDWKLKFSFFLEFVQLVLSTFQNEVIFVNSVKKVFAERGVCVSLEEIVVLIDLPDSVVDNLN